METTYLIISSQDAQIMDWTGLDQTIESCRKSLDGSLYLVSWSGQIPSTLDGITFINVMDYAECLSVMETTEWFITSEE